MVEREAEALRDGEQAARERAQAAAEMENTLIAQEQAQERTGIDPEEQVLAYDEPLGSGAPPEFPASLTTREVEYEGEERTFEGDGPHPLEEQ
jgi:hypothetical protein